MKGTVMSAAVAAAAMAGAANAAHVHPGRHHELFARYKKGTDMETCTPQCTTVWETFYGEATYYHPMETKPTSTYYETTTEYVVPTPEVEKCPTPGTYTFDATTMTLTETTTVCAATTTKCGKGVHTYGGVTTVVEHETTVVCPYAKETETDGVVTSVIETTTYVCPSAGTYTINPSTTTVTVEETVVVYPIVTSYYPGTYSKPAHVVTVTETDYVTVCPWVGGPTPEPEVPAPAPEPYVPEPVEEPVKEPEAPVVEAPVAKTPSGFTPASGLGGNGADHWAITYTPYTEDSGQCKDRAAVFADIENIKNMGFNTVRIYSTDCNTLENVGDACEEKGLKIIAGVFVKAGMCGMHGETKEQVDKLVAWGKWHLVTGMVIGNEAVFGGHCSAGGLKALIDTCKGIFSGAGYNGPYTTAETPDVWDAHSGTLCDCVDIVGANTHAYFDSNVSPSGAGPHVRKMLDLVSSKCGGKRAISLECGWPSAGNANGAAVAGPSQQKMAIDSIRSECGSDVVLFTYGHAFWKGDSACGCEPYFNVEAAFQ